MSEETKQKLTLKYRSKLLMVADSIGTIRTGQQWFDRYMIFPWERPSEFEQVK